MTSCKYLWRTRPACARLWRKPKLKASQRARPPGHALLCCMTTPNPFDKESPLTVVRAFNVNVLVVFRCTPEVRHDFAGISLSDPVFRSAGATELTNDTVWAHRSSGTQIQIAILQPSPANRSLPQNCFRLTTISVQQWRAPYSPSKIMTAKATPPSCESEITAFETPKSEANSAARP